MNLFIFLNDELILSNHSFIHDLVMDEGRNVTIGKRDGKRT